MDLIKSVHQFSALFALGSPPEPRGGSLAGGEPEQGERDVYEKK